MASHQRALDLREAPSLLPSGGAWGTLTLGPDGYLWGMDPLARELLQFFGEGRSEKEVFAQLSSHGRDLVAQLSLAAQEGRGGQAELPPSRPGDSRHLEVLALPIRDATEGHAGICLALRDRAGGALANAQAGASATGLLAAADRERRQIARQLHDHLCPRLLGAAFLGRSIVLGNPPPSAEAVHLQQLIEQLNAAVREAQSIVRGGECTGLAPANFRAALLELTRFLPPSCRVEIQAEDTSVPLPALMARQGLPIAREAVMNSAWHASATRARMGLRSDLPGVCQLEISDNGCGFDGLRAAPSRMGLELIRLRAWEAGGGLAVHTANGRGTTVVFIMVSPK